MSVAILATVFIGFAPTYYLKGYFRDSPLTPLVHLHGLVFTSWIVLFFTQTVLVSVRRTDLHRRLGDAAIARWPLAMMQTNPNAFFDVTDLFVAAVVLLDVTTRRRLHPATVAGGLLIIGSQPLRLAISHTHAWAGLAAALLQ